MYKAGSTTTFSSDAFPAVSLSVENLNFSRMIVMVKRIETMQKSKDEC